MRRFPFQVEEMSSFRKRIYISNTSGLANRLETLVLAAMIEDYFGHSIHLDWPEADCLRIAGTSQGKIAPWERPFSTKIRDFDMLGFENLGSLGVIALRGTYGPRELQKRFVIPTAARLRPHPRIGRVIREAFAPYGNRPAVAVHIRQGDFTVSNDRYDATAARHPAPGLWWYEHVMTAYVRRFPDVYFVIGYSGDDSSLQQLRSRFDIVTLPKLFPYQTLLPGHVSEGHPVVDMFAMACCSTLIATPTSGFSHWAANLLGPNSSVVLPPPCTERSNPCFCTGSMPGCVFLDWREAAEHGSNVVLVESDKDISPPSPPVTDWL
jgi:hypothetical protein